MHSIKLGKDNSLTQKILIGFALLFFIIAGIIHQQTPSPIIKIEKQDSAINLNQDFLLFFNFGTKRLLADLLWVRTLLESDEIHYANKDLNSWMYLRFLSIAKLDAYFYENYLYGGLYLSIVKDDVYGAADIYTKGLKYFPSDYNLNYQAGFNYYFEMGEFSKGLEHLEKIQNHPKAPSFVKHIVNKLKLETTQNYELAIEFLKNNYLQAQDPKLKKKLWSDIYALQTEMDLNCLNAHRIDCAKKDLEGFDYVKRDEQWYSAMSFTPYRIRLKNGFKQ